ncbi:hypothetical protein BDZ89DRAFT_1129850 [Hymenopellis radicata]|nr:hypothetical protein BDZ89DRAFT_1129850 [Hymenopellis radicata]
MGRGIVYPIWTLLLSIKMWDTHTATASLRANPRENIRLYIKTQRSILYFHYCDYKIVKPDGTVATPTLPVLNENGVDNDVHLWLETFGLPDLEAGFGAIGVYDMLGLKLLGTVCLLGPEVASRVARAVGAGPEPRQVQDLVKALTFIVQ